MVKRLVKKANAVKASKKTKVIKPVKKSLSKQASKTIKKKPAIASKLTKKTTTKISPAKAKTVKTHSKIKAKKPVSLVKVSPAKKPVVKKPIEKKIANKVILKSKVVKETTKKIALPSLHYQKIPGEEYMNPEQQKHFREVLLKWKKQLLGEMERTVHHMQDEAANFPDPNDRATQEEEFSLELRARDRERKLIKKIDEALQRLDSQDYGYCEACGVEIGVQRLDARPTATLCIDCKTIDEIREKHFS